MASDGKGAWSNDSNTFENISTSLLNLVTDNPGTTASIAATLLAASYGYAKRNMIADIAKSFSTNFAGNNGHSLEALATGSAINPGRFLKVENEVLPRLIIRDGNSSYRIHSLFPGKEAPMSFTLAETESGRTSLKTLLSGGPQTTITKDFSFGPFQPGSNTEFTLLSGFREQIGLGRTTIFEPNENGIKRSFIYRPNPEATSNNGESSRYWAEFTQYVRPGADIEFSFLPNGKLNSASWGTWDNRVNLVKDKTAAELAENKSTYTLTRTLRDRTLGFDSEANTTTFQNVSAHRHPKDDNIPGNTFRFNIMPENFIENPALRLAFFGPESKNKAVLTTPELPRRLNSEPGVTNIERALIEKLLSGK